MLMNKQSSDKEETVVYGSDIIVDILKEYGIEFVAANIGSTFRGLWDSIVNYGGDEWPQTISCCHEEIAVAIAHGYAKATEKPMGVLVHDTVGLLHATMAIFNAWVDRVPIIIMGACGTMDSSKRRPWIDWIHTSLIPNDVVRNYVKWDDFPFAITSVPQSFVRAYNLAVTEPAAPVFINFDMEYLEEKLAAPKLAAMSKSSYREDNPPPSYPSVDSRTLEKLAKFLLEAQNPLIIAGTTGGHKSSVQPLIQLAEVTGSGVWDSMDRFSFPNTHPLDSEKSALREADTILALDSRRLEFLFTNMDMATRSIKSATRSDTRIATVGVDDLLVKSWSNDYQGLVPIEFSILAETSKLLPELAETCRRIVSSDSALARKVSERTAKVMERHQRERASYLEQAKAQWDDSPISVPRLAAEVWNLIKGKSFVIANGSLAGWTRKLWDWEEPGCYLGMNGGAGLGSGLPASVGVALGLRNSKKLVIDFQPDGDLLMTPGTFWTAAHYRAPLLIVMFNNRLYYNDAEHNKRVAEMRGRDADRVYHNGGDIDDPAVDFGLLARSQGVWGEGPITKPEDIAPAVTRALRVVEVDRKPALVDVVTKAR